LLYFPFTNTIMDNKIDQQFNDYLVYSECADEDLINIVLERLNINILIKGIAPVYQLRQQYLVYNVFSIISGF